MPSIEVPLIAPITDKGRSTIMGGTCQAMDVSPD
jgi:hypothetical protein